MEREPLTLDRVAIGESFCVERVGGDATMKCRLEDLGIVEGTWIQCLMRSPLGDPCAYWIRGAVIALRDHDARSIMGRRSEEERSSDVWE